MTPEELLAKCKQDWFVTIDDIAEIEQIVTQLQAERDHFKNCISAKEVRRIVDERDKWRAAHQSLLDRFIALSHERNRIIASANEASFILGEAYAKLETERDALRALLLKIQDQGLSGPIDELIDAALRREEK
jgi:hypothetical protein